jgi:hypothetical protein
LTSLLVKNLLAFGHRQPVKPTATRVDAEFVLIDFDFDSDWG